MLVVALCFTACKDDPTGNPIESGTTGNLSWTLTDNGTLTIKGNGAMPDYEFQHSGVESPWYSYQNKIKTVVIEHGVTNIGNDVFFFCTNLKSITISNSVTNIGDYAFSGCHSLTNVTIPNSVTSIGKDAFSYCSNLTSIIIPNSVTNIGEGVFYNCSGLKSITFPNNVTSIGSVAFYDCTALTKITVKAKLPPDVYYYCFEGVNRSIPVYVPQESLQAYKTASVWKEFTNLQGRVF